MRPPMNPVVQMRLAKDGLGGLEIWLGDHEASCGESRTDWMPRPIVTLSIKRMVDSLFRLVTGKSQVEQL